MSGKTAKRIKNIAERMTVGHSERATHNYAKRIRKQYRKLSHIHKGDFLRKMEKSVA